MITPNIVRPRRGRIRIAIAFAIQVLILSTRCPKALIFFTVDRVPKYGWWLGEFPATSFRI
jgi:hypothetical protein